MKLTDEQFPNNTKQKSWAHHFSEQVKLAEVRFTVENLKQLCNKRLLRENDIEYESCKEIIFQRFKTVQYFELNNYQGLLTVWI